MANDLQLFDFNDHSIRVIEIDGVAWFPAKDVCDASGSRQLAPILHVFRL